MHKTTVETSFANHPKEGRLLARVLADNLRRVQGGILAPHLSAVVTGEIRRDWSDPGDDLPSF